ncbi:hypothetical protein Tco_1025166 [Tanacetum coccineum]
MRACVINFGGSYHSSIRCAPFEALYGRKCRSPVLWAEIGESSLIVLELVQETTDKEPIEIIDREVKSLKHSKISLAKVRWNSKRGPEFTWEREDYMKSNYPQLVVDRADELVH